ncbi:MAG: hypothetical protein FWD53_09470, partial [Phycisphaerales bacterium]|nr:hypothetical protein [Phycisphaerales bacterium]
MLSKTRRPRPIRKYQHFLETLETRILLDVSPTEFAQLRTMYPDLNLSSNMSTYNVIEVTADNLTSFRNALTDSSITTTGNQPNLIVVRTATTHTIQLASQLTIDTNASDYGSIIIVSLGSAPFTIDAQENGRVLGIDPGAEVKLAGLTISGGKADNGAGIYNSGTLTVAYSTIQDNWAENYGGGIYNDEGATLMLINATVMENCVFASENAYGGGIYNNKGGMALTNSTIA